MRPDACVIRDPSPRAGVPRGQPISLIETIRAEVEVMVEQLDRERETL